MLRQSDEGDRASCGRVVEAQNRFVIRVCERTLGIRASVEYRWLTAFGKVHYQNS